MKDRLTIKKIIKDLESEQINTWFDLGLFLDRIKEERLNQKEISIEGVRGIFNYLEQGAMAFITFHYSVDGVTVEIQKYAELIKRNMPDISMHYIGGIFTPESEKLIPGYIEKFEFQAIQGFDEWNFYKRFFSVRMERGSAEYNSLIIDFWKESLEIIKTLGEYILKNDIRLLYLVNVASNPGNVSLTLASVLLSEYLGLPVINNNHDFYWEGGSQEGLLSKKKNKKGPRDFFFTNAHLGEFFSIIEMLFPWESKRWIHVNINKSQSAHLINNNGLNPANIMEIGTAVDTNEYINIDKRKKINAFFQLEKILSRYKEKLIVYSIEDVINNQLVDVANPMPILIGYKTKPINKFIAENIIFLQPTRIISRKRIEVGFRLLLKMIEKKGFRERLIKTKNLKLTILVTGPVASGHYEYFLKLLKRFSNLLNEVDEALREKIFVSFLFSELDKESFKKRFEYPVRIPELYNIASLVLLPSKTEGRGLPIIESTACGTPIFVRKYAPENVYDEVVGNHLSEEDRLKVIEYDGKNIKRKFVNDIIERVLFPHKFTEEINHNRTAVIRRFSLEALNNNLREIFYRLSRQIKESKSEKKTLIPVLKEYQKSFINDNDNLKEILNDDNRQYLAGYGKLSFMIYLKSLIDPSYFRVEQMEFKGRAFTFALDILKKDPYEELIPLEKKIKFFNAIEELFNYHEGEVKIRHDHSMSYRHRNRNYYPYQDYTFQELTGIINSLYFEIIEPTVITQVKETPHFFTDWNLALFQLTGSTFLGIDNRNILIKKLKSNKPIAYFPGEFIMHELELFVLQPVRSRLRLSIEEVLTRDLLDVNQKNIAKIYVFVQQMNLGNQLNMEETREYILSGKNEELKLLYEYHIIRLVPTKQKTVGIHFAQLGSEALKTLKEVKNEKGFLITNRRNAALMTDIVDIDRFHIGKIRSRIAENMMGIPMDSGFIQFVPAGLRAVLTYPVPVQTAKDFSRALAGKLFRNLKERIGEENLLEYLRKDAETMGSPIVHVLEKLDAEEESLEGKFIDFNFISGVYNDRNPYNGVIANLNLNDFNWEFIVASTVDKPMKVTDFVKQYKDNTGNEIHVAWNGGYILNPELVGKLGLKESFIGSPLGMIISNGKMLCPPLFNKSALLIYEDGTFDIRRVNSSSGFTLKAGEKVFKTDNKTYNNKNPEGELCYYDLLYEDDYLQANQRIIVQLAGNVVKDIIKLDEKNPTVKLIPVGITLSFHKNAFPENLKINDEVEFSFEEFKNVKQAIEAGPMLLDYGQICVDMKTEGWRHRNSINTQAARLDFTDMRGPKIAAGINEKGNLLVLAINGRIRESVGATHEDMARILQEHGIQKAMGFDPGGSSTLVIDEFTRNISPYNAKYEKNIYALPPQPRAVSNAILGYIKNI